MALSIRERSMSVAVLVAGAVFLGDRLALSPYLERRRALVEREQSNARALADVRHVMQRDQRLRRLLRDMGASVRADPSAAEGRFLDLLHEWERRAGVGKTSFQRVRAVEKYGFVHLTFQVSASGPIGGVASLIYLVETAPIPLRVDEMQVLPGRDGGELQVQFSLSTLCRKPGADVPPPREEPGVASVDLAGGRR